MAIQKFNNIICSCLDNSWSSEISNRLMYNTTKNWKYLVTNFNGINVEVIADKALLRLSIYILAMRYLKKKTFCFIKIIEDDKELNKYAKIVSDSKEEIKIKNTLYKKKKDTRALLLVATCLSTVLSLSISIIPILGLFFFLSISVMLMPLLRLSTFLFTSAILMPVFDLSALLSISVFAVPMLELFVFPSTIPVSIPRSSAPPSAMFIPILGLFTLLFAALMPISRLFTPLFVVSVPVLGSSAFISLFTMPRPGSYPLFLIWSSL